MKNLAGMLKQAQQMQSKMQEMQDGLLALEIEGQSGAGMVKVMLNGKGEMRGLKIDQSIVDPQETEVLEDLIVAAYNDAKVKVEAAVQDKMKDVTGGMNLPEGFKLPF
ncbi:YbaB/EbfC family nucleoid-associated protein [Thalassospira alkalitolerans]|uniref:Nucleoid-associated protein TALK_02700 n=1 Tax=Thalassospira alkalitolerans TaxID=1293890 RepID=A0A1Y2LH14_9PROT|nr:YbaB/EbfC family nucleoid-associated protein [Thalassospira alkalitolerans]OSQ50376.1 nucleoid-associated protein [Thalassospira alkalitolerans]|tara:strand:- start:39584 stop:39907 length:324 start_codon:yes stop_codon:yes gene_type:complete